MDIEVITGNDFAYNLCNLGEVHGHTVAPSLEKFITDLYSKKSKTRRALVATTNNSQRKVREYLRACDFAEVPCGNLIVHTLSREKFESLTERAAEMTKKLEEEKKARLEAQRLKDEKEGRKKGELRVGDVVLYDNYGNTPYILRSVREVGGVWYGTGYSTRSDFMANGERAHIHVASATSDYSNKHWTRYFE